MKKNLYIVMSALLLLSLTACAPKTNSTPKQEPDSAVTTPYAVYESFTLYFPSSDDLALVKETHDMRIYDDITKEKLIIDALKMGPKDDDLESPLAYDAAVQSIKTISGLCTIDFNGQFLNLTEDIDDADPNETARLMLQAVVQSICELETVEEVKFNINGNTAAKINEEIDLSKPISPDITEL